MHVQVYTFMRRFTYCMNRSIICWLFCILELNKLYLLTRTQRCSFQDHEIENSKDSSSARPASGVQMICIEENGHIITGTRIYWNKGTTARACLAVTMATKWCLLKEFFYW